MPSGWGWEGFDQEGNLIDRHPPVRVGETIQQWARGMTRESREDWEGPSKMPYDKYLLTDDWKDFRDLVVMMSGGSCQKCNARRRLHVHHLTYARRGREKLQDVGRTLRAMPFRRTPGYEDKGRRERGSGNTKRPPPKERPRRLGMWARW